MESISRGGGGDCGAAAAIAVAIASVRRELRAAPRNRRRTLPGVQPASRVGCTLSDAESSIRRLRRGRSGATGLGPLAVANGAEGGDRGLLRLDELSGVALLKGAWRYGSRDVIFHLF